MTPARKATSVGKGLTALFIVTIALGSGVIYYNAVGQRANPSVGSTNTVSTTSSAQSSNTSTQGQPSTAAAANGQTNSSSQSTAEAIYAADSRSIVTVQGDESVTLYSYTGRITATQPVLGSGFIISYQSADYVVSNYHVVNGVSNLTVTFWNGDAYAAKAIGTDPYSDLAILLVSGAPVSEYVPLTIISSSGVAVGESVYVIGNPYGLSGSFTYGLVSQLGRTLQESTTGNYSIAGVIQFSAPINPGNSGGPLLDGSGEVIGMTTAVVSGSQGLGFAIPSSSILREIPSLISAGSYSSHPYLGIGSADMSYQLAQVAKTNTTYGVLVEGVVNGGPAASAGIRAGSTDAVVDGQRYLIGGDVIVSINGTRIVNQDALSTYLEQNTVGGQTIQVGIVRAGDLLALSVTLGTRPA